MWLCVFHVSISTFYPRFNTVRVITLYGNIINVLHMITYLIRDNMIMLIL